MPNFEGFKVPTKENIDRQTNRQEIEQNGKAFEADLARKRLEAAQNAKSLFEARLITPVNNFVAEMKRNKEYGGRFKKFVQEADNMNF